MTEIAASRSTSIAFWTLFAIAIALAVGTIAVLGPSVEIPSEVAGGAVKTKATWKLLVQPAAMLVVWFAFRIGARANLGGGCFGRTADDDADVARASGTFARTLVNAALGWAVVILALQIISVGRLAGVEPFTSLHGPVVVRGFFVAAGAIEIFMGNAWPKSAPAPARAGDGIHVHRMRRFRGWWMTLNGLAVVVCALTLPVTLLVLSYFALWLTKVVALNVANALDGGPRQGAADVR
jgi:hypothetical protein